MLQPTLLIAGIAAATAFVVGGYASHKATQWYYAGKIGEYVQAERDAAQAAIRSMEAHMVASAEQARREQAQAVLNALERNRLTTTVQEVINEATRETDGGACDWRDVDRLRVESIYSAYGHRASRAASAGRVPDGVRAPTADGRTDVPGVGADDRRVGAGLRADFQGLPAGAGR